MRQKIQPKWSDGHPGWQEDTPEDFYFTGRMTQNSRKLLEVVEKEKKKKKKNFFFLFPMSKGLTEKCVVLQGSYKPCWFAPFSVTLVDPFHKLSLEETARKTPRSLLRRVRSPRLRVTLGTNRRERQVSMEDAHLEYLS